MIPVVLASASPRRKALLNNLGIDVQVRVSEIQESCEGTPEDVVLRNARDKRDDVASTLSEAALVVAADTIVVLKNRILGKPGGLDEARAMLASLSGETHRVLTGVAVVDTDSRKHAEGIEITEVTFRDLAPWEIDRFVDAIHPLDRAGAYTVDGPGSLLVESYSGCYQNVLGLPIVRLNRLLREIGDDLFARMDSTRARFL